MVMNMNGEPQVGLPGIRFTGEDPRGMLNLLFHGTLRA